MSDEHFFCSESMDVWTLYIHHGRMARLNRSAMNHAQNQAKAAVLESDQSPASVTAGPEGGAGAGCPTTSDKPQQLHAGTRLRGGPASARGTAGHRHVPGRVEGLLYGP